MAYFTKVDYPRFCKFEKNQNRPWGATNAENYTHPL